MVSSGGFNSTEIYAAALTTIAKSDFKEPFH
jgi:hypothetical protein